MFSSSFCDEGIKSQAGKVIVEGNAVKLSAMWFHLQTVLFNKDSTLVYVLGEHGDQHNVDFTMPRSLTGANGF